VDLAEAVAALTPAMSMATTRDLSVISS